MFGGVHGLGGEKELFAPLAHILFGALMAATGPGAWAPLRPGDGCPRCRPRMVRAGAERTTANGRYPISFLVFPRPEHPAGRLHP